MMVSCDLFCPYRSQNGFCRRRVLAIRGGICQFFDKLQKGITEQPLYFDNIDYSKQEEEEENAALVMNEDESQNECVEEAETADDKDRSDGSQTEEIEEDGGSEQNNGLD